MKSYYYNECDNYVDAHKYSRELQTDKPHLYAITRCF